MDTNDDFYGKELNLNCFYIHTNFEQKYPKTAIVSRTSDKLHQLVVTANLTISHAIVYLDDVDF